MLRNLVLACRNCSVPPACYYFVKISLPRPPHVNFTIQGHDLYPYRTISRYFSRGEPTSLTHRSCDRPTASSHLRQWRSRSGTCIPIKPVKCSHPQTHAPHSHRHASSEEWKTSVQKPTQSVKSPSASIQSRNGWPGQTRTRRLIPPLR